MKKTDNLHIKIGLGCMKALASVRNVGLIPDSTLSVEKQVNSTCKLCYRHIRNMCFVRKYITEKTSKPLVQALASSRLVYGQNHAARLVTDSHKRDHITPIPFQPHRLPTQYSDL